MTEPRKQPSQAPQQAAQADQGLPADRGQFETQLQQAVAHASNAPPAGAGAMPNLGGVWKFLAGALTDPAVRDLLWSLFQKWQGKGGTEQPPAPPPEPTS